ncbi:MAG: hypothetical protein QOD83_2827 [Solirubrobacteraceae bacterium]|nr:hypothetical protein [Solirubrobacteraceae bacterium]
MISDMAATPQGPALASLRELRRDPHNGMVAGICAGLGKRLQIDPMLLRIVFGASTLASGVGIAVYGLAWIFLPAEDEEGAPAVATARTASQHRAAVEVGTGVGFLLLALLLAFRELGLPFSDVVTWPLVLVGAGGALIWRQSIDVSGRVARAVRGNAVVTTGSAVAIGPASTESRPAVISRIGIGVTLVISAALVFLQLTGALAAATDVALVAVVVAVALAVIFAPWFVRLLTSLSNERAERVRSQERAEFAAHLHDSVLQTLALMQKRADDPRAVAALARRQERELRTWLSGAPARREGERWLAAALQAAAEEIEREHGVAVDVVAVGDAALDRDGEALVAAAREAMLNAAKFAGDSAPVAVYAEAGGERLQVFVRDRGPGFNPDAVPADRRGVRESIVGRMERHGGRAAIQASPGGGTEVELVLERDGGDGE